MNPYLKNLEKIEFVVTYACTGSCRHCSEGSHEPSGIHIDPLYAADTVRKIASEYDIKTVMTFGGEPLLYPEAVYSVMNAACEMNVPKRQVITNGFFGKDEFGVRAVAERLYECGVNDLLLSVDAFHAECIPVEAVMLFASELVRVGVPVRTQPAWLVSREECNPYNCETRRLLADFERLSIYPSDGNIVFPKGNAAVYLKEYFTHNAPADPYIEDPLDIRCISVEPDGDVLNGNIYRHDIMKIIEDYSKEGF